MEILQIGEIKLTWLDGGVTFLDGGAMFGVVPKPLWTRKYEVNEKNQIECRTDPILVEAFGKKMLIESGIGNGKLSDKEKRNYGVTRESKLIESLNELNIRPEDIDIVMMTHLHFDHACGLTTYDEEKGKYVSVFKNAEIICSDVEWNEMRNPNIRSKSTYWVRNWEGIEEQVKTFSGEIELAPGIKMVHTGGHSDGHSIIILESNGEMAIHLADLLPTHAHQNPLWVMAYDDYPMNSIREKLKWIPYAREKDAWLTFYHDAVYRAVKWDEAGQLKNALPIKK